MAGIPQATVTGAAPILSQLQQINTVLTGIFNASIIDCVISISLPVIGVIRAQIPPGTIISALQVQKAGLQAQLNALGVSTT